MFSSQFNNPLSIWELQAIQICKKIYSVIYISQYSFYTCFVKFFILYIADEIAPV